MQAEHVEELKALEAHCKSGSDMPMPGTSDAELLAIAESVLTDGNVETLAQGVMPFFAEGIHVDTAAIFVLCLLPDAGKITSSGDYRGAVEGLWTRPGVVYLECAEGQPQLIAKDVLDTVVDLAMTTWKGLVMDTLRPSLAGLRATEAHMEMVHEEWTSDPARFLFDTFLRRLWHGGEPHLLAMKDWLQEVKRFVDRVVVTRSFRNPHGVHSHVFALVQRVCPEVTGQDPDFILPLFSNEARTVSVSVAVTRVLNELPPPVMKPASVLKRIAKAVSVRNAVLAGLQLSRSATQHQGVVVSLDNDAAVHGVYSAVSWLARLHDTADLHGAHHVAWRVVFTLLKETCKDYMSFMAFDKKPIKRLLKENDVAYTHYHGEPMIFDMARHALVETFTSLSANGSFPCSKVRVSLTYLMQESGLFGLKQKPGAALADSVPSALLSQPFIERLAAPWLGNAASGRLTTSTNTVNPRLHGIVPTIYSFLLKSLKPRGSDRTFSNFVTAKVTWLLGLLLWSVRELERTAGFSAAVSPSPPTASAPVPAVTAAAAASSSVFMTAQRRRGNKRRKTVSEEPVAAVDVEVEVVKEGGGGGGGDGNGKPRGLLCCACAELFGVTETLQDARHWEYGCLDHPLCLTCGVAWVDSVVSTAATWKGGNFSMTSMPVCCDTNCTNTGKPMSSAAFHCLLMEHSTEDVRALAWVASTSRDPRQRCGVCNVPGALPPCNEENGICVTCTVCAQLVCSMCYLPAHFGVACPASKSLDSRRTTTPEIVLSEAKLQRCGSCKTASVKSYGCNHITCKSCGHQWCWACAAALDPRDPSEHYRTSRCSQMAHDDKTETERMTRAIMARADITDDMKHACIHMLKNGGMYAQTWEDA